MYDQVDWEEFYPKQWLFTFSQTFERFHFYQFYL
jgi:hypothetical protein